MSGTYKDFLKANYSKVGGNEKVMWATVEGVSDLLEQMKIAHPQAYWDFMRKQHEIVCGKHFDESYATWQVSQMSHMGADGKEYKGQHWSLEDTNGVLVKYRSKIPSAYNEWDFYVALNATYHDYVEWAKKHIPDDVDNAIITSAVTFWMMDYDWGDDSKVWEYFACKPNAKKEGMH